MVGKWAPIWVGALEKLGFVGLGGASCSVSPYPVSDFRGGAVRLVPRGAVSP